MPKEDYLEAARKILKERYPTAIWAYVAGSIVRNEATETSDIDLVVLFEKLPAAYRESFTAYGWPVEAFVHDSETIEYFFKEMDRKSGMPSLPSMVAEGIIVPEKSPGAEAMKARAKSLLADGPAPLTAEEIAGRRYAITDFVDDLRAPRNAEESLATMVRLYEALADFYFRANRRWSARGKSIPRTFLKVDAGLGADFSDAFHRSIETGNPQLVIELAERILRPHGGFLFDGDRREAPADWRRVPSARPPSSN